MDAAICFASSEVRGMTSSIRLSLAARSICERVDRAACGVSGAASVAWPTGASAEDPVADGTRVAAVVLTSLFKVSSW